MDIFTLHTKSHTEKLDTQEVAWLQSLVKQYPFYALPHIILAKYHHENHSTVKDKSLQKAATYSLNRGLLKSYILGDITGYEATTTSEVAEVPAVIPDAEVPAVIPDAEVPAVIPEVEVPAVIPDAKVAKTPDAEVPVAVEEDETSENTGEETDENEGIKAEEESVETAVSEESADDVVDEVVAKDAEADADVDVDVDVDEAAEEAQYENEEENAEAEESQTAEEDSKTPPATDQETTIPNPNPVGKINWYLNTRVSLREEKYKRLAQKIRAEISDFQPENATADNDPLESVADTTTSVAEKAADAVTPQPQKDSPASESGNEEMASETENAENTEERSSSPIELDISSLDNTEASDTEASENLKPAAKSTAAPGFTEGEGNEKEGTYQIGAFSSFTFLDDSQTDEQEEEVDAHILEAEAVELKQTEDSDLSEIVFEEEDRVVEISVTPEQLAKYFGGKKPVAPTKESTEITEDPTKEIVVEPETTVVLHPTLQKQEDIIEKFIQNEPTISHPKEVKVSKGNLAAKSTVDREDIVTETLARIHADQGNISKAVKIYKKLSLLFPEKSDYFVDQIKNLKK